MKTFNQFCTEAYQLDENILTNNALTRGLVNNPVTSAVDKFAKKYQPLKNITRFMGAQDALNKNLPTTDRVFGALSTVAPYSAGVMQTVFNQGKPDSVTSKVSKMGPETIKVPGTSFGVGTKPSTDLGKRSGDALVNTAVKAVNTRNRYLSQMKPTSSLMGGTGLRF
jgi:hypothetical protein